MDRLKRIGLGMNLDQQLAVIPLLRHKTYRIGRNPDQEIRILDDMISRCHTILTFDQDKWHAEDRHSLNKTFVNGQPLVPLQVCVRVFLVCVGKSVCLCVSVFVFLFVYLCVCFLFFSVCLSLCECL